MSLIREVFQGYAKRVRTENHLQLQKMMVVRPEQIQLEAAAILKGIADELSDPVLKALFDSPKVQSIKAPEIA